MRRQMLECCPDAQPKFVATLPNHKLIFAGWSRKWRGGVASSKLCKGEKLIGAIYEISERCLRSLDKCEGYPTTYFGYQLKRGDSRRDGSYAYYLYCAKIAPTSSPGG